MGQDCCKSNKPKVTDINTVKSTATEPAVKELNVLNARTDPVFKVLGSENLSELKSKHDKVVAAIQSIPPKYREEYSSCPIMVVDSNSSDKKQTQIKAKIMERINNDLKLNNKIPSNLTTKINNMFDSTIWAKKYREDYCEIDLSYDSGGVSWIRIGFMGFKKVQNEMIIGLCLYFEKWKERDDVKISKDNKVWCKENVKAFAKYLLYQKVGKDFQHFVTDVEEAEQKQIHDKVYSNQKVEEDKKKMETELYKFLKQRGLNEYYHNFIKDGYDQVDDISGINVCDKEQLEKLGITKTGHINRLTKAIKELQTKQSDNAVTNDQIEGQQTLFKQDSLADNVIISHIC